VGETGTVPRDVSEQSDTPTGPSLKRKRREENNIWIISLGMEVF
jgi:hypothetical protein